MTALLFDKNGYFIRDLPYSFRRSWLLNQYGSCEWDMPVADFTADFNFGNYILLQHETLGDWGGIIAQPREWGEDGSVKLKAYSAEYALTRRRGDAEQALSGSSGEIFNTLLNIANTKYPTLIHANSLYTGGDTLAQLVNVTDIYSLILQLIKDSGNDMHIYPAMEDNKLTFRADWLKKLGRQIEDPNVVLILGKNISGNGTPLIEQGDVVNDLLAYGKGDTWQDRALYFTQDRESQTLYGVCQGSIEVDGEAVDQLAAAAQAELVKTRSPRRTFKLTAVNKDGIFQYLRKGNVLKVEMDTIGFHQGRIGTIAYARLLGLDYDPEPETCDLVADEEIQ